MNPPRRHPKVSTVFLIDVDQTLLDDELVMTDLRRHLRKEIGREGERQYLQILQRLQRALGYADYLGALQQYRQSYPHDPHVLTVSSYLINYPFESRVFPHAVRLIKRCRRLGTVVILSDGDVVFQPHKIERSGLAAAVNNHVLIYVHKEHQIKDIEACYPADRYIVIDDSLRILSTVKKVWGKRVTTIWRAPSRSAERTNGSRRYLDPDRTIHSIGDLKKKDLRAMASQA
jgi:FMN phosphatase YigB (HAD superfamily)